MIHHGDCVQVMATLDAESIDAIVTDPPYGLEFMGVAWDTMREGGTARTRNEWGDFGSREHARTADEAPRIRRNKGVALQAFSEAWAVEALRVAKPGAYLLAFGGTRTYHRLASAIEDAGWEIRDCLVWAYASGFPKSHNLHGEREGWGTALKPAWEPIVMARKPLRGTVAANVAQHGTGALNIDGCRIGPPMTQEEIARTGGLMGVADGRTIYGDGRRLPAGNDGGRWPANVLLTDPIFDGDVPGVVGGGAQEGGGNPAFRSGEALNRAYSGGLGANGDQVTGLVPFDTSGTYSRFFLVPKAARSDREPVLGGLPLVRGGAETMDPRVRDGSGDARMPMRANVHPTVKPTDLMRHLVRLVTPPGGLVLDPFLGSGTTALACEMEGFRWVGIEREAEYVAIAEARLNGTQRGLGLGA